MDGRNFSNENNTIEYGSDEYDYYHYVMNVIKPQLSERDFLPSALPVLVKGMLVVCYLIIIFVNIVGNVMVICIICRYDKMRTVTNTFLGSLAVSGFFSFIKCIRNALFNCMLHGRQELEYVGQIFLQITFHQSQCK